ncbi:hypothetical protein HYH02_001748 [Chlamydomonas schloesseri]|uniref:Polymerase nucleotidyl transferase domain-containing protein n=1 Tax=Chlamydomonas schloesseri TaxID=2026947 RepID=A0A835WUJ1_9CHLO|nr:hypothetical protein HYH02_001748 [Chlamydomonas schloesseri]|eukprot:KAG2453528.1 hypothetical protein HYH02_001748 [Chlamydomonas schloesseri]
MPADDDELKCCYLDLKRDKNKEYVRYFNGHVLPLTLRGVSYNVPKAVTDTVVRRLHECPDLQVGRVHIGGSYGRATLVRGAFDVDLSVFVNEYKGRELHDLKEWGGEAGERLQRDMQKHVARWLRQSNASEQVVEVEYGTHYKHCINVKVDGVEVDIKLVPSVVPGSQAKDLGKAQRDALMQTLLDTPPEKRCADPVREAALAEALTAFVKNTPERVKRVVRLIKCCVLLEALVLTVAGWEENPGAREAEVRCFQGALNLMQFAVAEGVIVDACDESGVWGHSQDEGWSCEHVWTGDPFVMLHPIDFTCNLGKAQPGRTVDWKALAWEAHELERVMREESMWALLHDSSLTPALKAMAAPDQEDKEEYKEEDRECVCMGSASAWRSGPRTIFTRRAHPEERLRSGHSSGPRGVSGYEPATMSMSASWLVPAAAAVVAGLALMFGSRMLGSGSGPSGRERR